MMDRKFSMVAEKFISEGKGSNGIVIRQYHQLVVSPEEVSTILYWATETFQYGDDPEQDYARGMYTGQPDICDLDYIEMDEFLEAIEDYLDNEAEIYLDEEDMPDKKHELVELKKFAGYTITIHEEMNFKEG